MIRALVQVEISSTAEPSLSSIPSRILLILSVSHKLSSPV
ncbi:unnamed protein product, partial [Rotaria sp. Silwood1]